MKLAFRPAGGAGAYVTLFDESTIAAVADPLAKTPGANPSWEPEFAGVNQNDAVFSLPGGAAKRFKRQLGNVAGSVTFEVRVAYGSRADAVASVRTWAGLFQGAAIHFQLTQDTEVQYYPNAVVDRYRGRINNGVGVTHSVTFTSDVVTAVAPP